MGINNFKLHRLISATDDVPYLWMNFMPLLFMPEPTMCSFSLERVMVGAAVNHLSIALFVVKNWPPTFPGHVQSEATEFGVKVLVHLSSAPATYSTWYLLLLVAPSQSGVRPTKPTKGT